MRDVSTKDRSQWSQALYRRRLETMVRAIINASVAAPLLLGAMDAYAQTAVSGHTVAAAVSSDQSTASDKSTLEQVVVIGQHMTAPAEVPIETAYSESTITADTIRALSAGPTVTAQTLLNS